MNEIEILIKWLTLCTNNTKDWTRLIIYISKTKKIHTLKIGSIVYGDT